MPSSNVGVRAAQLNRWMRVLPLITVFALAALLDASHAGDVVTVPLTPDLRIEQRIAAIDGPDWKLGVVVTSGTESKSRRQQVTVRGPISAHSVEGIVRSALASEKGYWSSTGTWEVHVVGDAKYAAVTVSTHCGELCGGGATYTYAYTNGQWNYQYTSDRWVS